MHLKIMGWAVLMHAIILIGLAQHRLTHLPLASPSQPVMIDVYHPPKKPVKASKKAPTKHAYKRNQHITRVRKLQAVKRQKPKPIKASKKTQIKRTPMLSAIDRAKKLHALKRQKPKSISKAHQQRWQQWMQHALAAEAQANQVAQAQAQQVARAQTRIQASIASWRIPPGQTGYRL